MCFDCFFSTARCGFFDTLIKSLTLFFACCLIAFYVWKDIKLLRSKKSLQLCYCSKVFLTLCLSFRFQSLARPRKLLVPAGSDWLCSSHSGQTGTHGGRSSSLQMAEQPKTERWWLWLYTGTSRGCRSVDVLTMLKKCIREGCTYYTVKLFA